MKRKFVLAVDLVLIVGTLIGVLWVVGYARPMVIAPHDDFITSDSGVLFEFSKGGLILIDNNLEFSSPREFYAEDDLVISLEPGEHYWKVQGVGESEVRKLTILSRVDLRVEDSGEAYGIVNAGNVELDVGVYEQGVLKENLILERGDSVNVGGDKFVGGQSE